MLYRVVDLSLPVTPQRGLSAPPLPPEIEPSGPERSRQSIQRICRVLPYRFDEYPDEFGLDVWLGDSLPHSHAESLLVNKVTILDTIPASQRWAIRDMAALPAAEFIREAAVIDLSQDDHEGPIPVSLLEKRAGALRYGDYVLLRTDFPKRFRGKLPEAEYRRRLPGLTMEAGRWLVESRGVVGIAADCLVDHISTWGQVHTYFYTHAVLMIDDMVNFDQIPAERVFFNGGVALRSAGIGSSPARPVALAPTGGHLAGSRIVDLWRPLAPVSGPVLQGKREDFRRQEPYALQGEIQKRYSVTGLQIAFEAEEEARRLAKGDPRPQRDFGSPVRLFSGALGTYLEVPYMPLTGGDIPAAYFTDCARVASESLVGRGRLFDLTHIGPRQVITADDLAGACPDLQAGEIPLIWTAFTDFYYARPDYLELSPGFSPEAVEWLVQRQIRLLVTDTATVEPARALPPPPKHNLARLFSANIPVVRCATNLWRLQKPGAVVMVAPVPFSGAPMMPARVVAVEEWE